MRNVTVITSLWSRSNNGKSPKGKGNWAFSIGNKDGYEDASKAVFFYGTYAEAKKEAVKAAAEKGASVVYVLP